MSASDPAWPLVQDWLAAATNAVSVIETTEERGRATLDALDGVTEQQTLGALALHSGGVLVDGWLLVLGAGAADVPGLRELNGRVGGAHAGLPGALVVAVDRLGGAFAIQGGGLPAGEVGELCFLAPDDLGWMPTELGHSAFVRWSVGGDVHGFYEDLRWPGWNEDVRALGPGQGFGAYPPPWTVEGRRGQSVSRRPVPLLEAYGVLLQASLRLRRPAQ